MKQKKRDKKHVKLLDFVLTLQNSECSAAAANYWSKFALKSTNTNVVKYPENVIW